VVIFKIVFPLVIDIVFEFLLVTSVYRVLVLCNDLKNAIKILLELLGFDFSPGKDLIHISLSLEDKIFELASDLLSEFRFYLQKIIDLLLCLHLDD
jgi:hypothetical protein